MPFLCLLWLRFLKEFTCHDSNTKKNLTALNIPEHQGPSFGTLKAIDPEH